MSNISSAGGDVIEQSDASVSCITREHSSLRGSVHVIKLYITEQWNTKYYRNINIENT